MEVDLFENEQRVYDNALNRITEVAAKAGEGAQFDFTEYAEITKEYGKLLKQLRRATRLADRTTIDLHESNLDLADKVHYDALTGIYNRRYMEDNLKRVIKSILRSGGGLLSVLMIDIDFFKKYNDTYGHGQGDACLKAIAKVLAASVMRPEDFTARYGGEEFVVILPNTDESGACGIADKILENVRACGISHEKSDAANCVTVSIGVTTAHVDLARDGGDYIKRADEALYMSKGNGRNQYTYLDFREAKHEV
ncbi:MAG: GGDEF domain-containing protein [Treponema sp.]|jgi:diguanylate cyclase (GGDEF)-like protein|nr:GGDEF domain-containing protein [Treponema sp.]